MYHIISCSICKKIPCICVINVAPNGSTNNGWCTSCNEHHVSGCCPKPFGISKCTKCNTYHITAVCPYQYHQSAIDVWKKTFKKLEDYTDAELESELRQRKDKKANRVKEINDEIEKLKKELESIGG